MNIFADFNDRIRNAIQTLDLKTLSGDPLELGRIVAEPRLPEAGGKAQIDEARPGDLGRRDIRIPRQRLADLRGKRARVLADRLAEHHGGVGGDVAMRRIARRLGNDSAKLKRIARQCFQIKRLDGFLDPIVEIGENVHSGLPVEKVSAARVQARNNSPIWPRPSLIPASGQTGAGAP
jgi:hypothetical protein